MASLIEALQAEALDASVPIADLLRKAKVVADKLDISELREWVDRELNGYGDDDEYPEYRKVQGELQAFNPYHGWQPILINKPEKAKWFFEPRKLNSPIGELEALPKDSDSVFTLHPSVKAKIVEGLEFPTDVRCLLNHSQLLGIPGQVRNRILDWSLRLQDIERRGRRTLSTTQLPKGEALKRALAERGISTAGLPVSALGFPLEAAMQGRLLEVLRLEREEEMARNQANDASVGTAVTTGNRVFVGHGGDQTWREVKDFLVDRLHLEYEEFNREATVGIPTAERLKRMLDDSVFALIVMTGEDEHGDGKRHARENVIHEIGLFQGRLGFRRAIVLLEEGCEEFSNIEGVTQIRFQRGRVSAKFEEIRRTLEREGLMSGSVAHKTLKTERQEDVAKDTFERPKLIVRNIVLNSPSQTPAPVPDPWFYQGARLAGQFYVVNVGGSPAKIAESGCWVIWKANEQPLPGLPMRRPYEGKDGNNPVLGSLGPGESAPGIFQSEDYLGNEIDRVRSGNWSLYVLGWVEYTDDRDMKRRTAFCRKYDANKRRFFAAEDDPDYEYVE